MKCSRCQGLIVKDQLCDPDGPYLHIRILRCLNCGGTTYPPKNKEGAGHPSIQKTFRDQRLTNGLEIIQTQSCE